MKSYDSLTDETDYFFMNGKEIIHSLNPFTPGFLLAAAISTVCFILAAFVSALFALSIQKRNCFRYPGANARKFASAVLFLLNAFFKFNGTELLSAWKSEAFKMFQLPSFLACSIFVRPAGLINFCSMSFSILCLFSLLQALFCFRGVNFKADLSSSIFFGRLSIQPKHNASSTASA